MSGAVNKKRSMMIKQADVCLLFLLSEPDGPFQKKKRPVMVDRLCFHSRYIPDDQGKTAPCSVPWRIEVSYSFASSLSYAIRS